MLLDLELEEVAMFLELVEDGIVYVLELDFLEEWVVCEGVVESTAKKIPHDSFFIRDPYRVNWGHLLCHCNLPLGCK